MAARVLGSRLPELRDTRRSVGFGPSRGSSAGALRRPHPHPTNASLGSQRRPLPAAAASEMTDDPPTTHQCPNLVGHCRVLGGSLDICRRRGGFVPLLPTPIAHPG